MFRGSRLRRNVTLSLAGHNVTRNDEWNGWSKGGRNECASVRKEEFPTEETESGGRKSSSSSTVR